MNASGGKKSIRLGGIVLVLGLFLSFPAAADTLCTGDEKVVFSCPSDGKLISVCANDKGVQYRFGNPGKLEAVLPASPALSGAVSVGELKYPQGGGMYLRFTGADADSVVYSAGDGDWEQSGVATLKAEKQIAERLCLPESVEMQNFHDFNVASDKRSFAVQLKNTPRP